MGRKFEYYKFPILKVLKIGPLYSIIKYYIEKRIINFLEEKPWYNLFHCFLSLFYPGKDHVCRFIGCGRNDRFNYVVMQLQVGYYEKVS